MRGKKNEPQLLHTIANTNNNIIILLPWKNLPNTLHIMCIMCMHANNSSSFTFLHCLNLNGTEQKLYFLNLCNKIKIRFKSEYYYNNLIIYL